MDAEAWKYGDPPELTEIRKHKMLRSRLLVVLPQYSLPLETYVGDISPNGDYIYLSGGWAMAGWFPREDMRIVDILPPKPVAPPKGAITKTGRTTYPGSPPLHE